MIIDEDIKQLIELPVLQPQNKLQIIERYIFDKKAEIVKINIPTDQINAMLMDIAFGVSKEYYLNKFKNGD
jgi:hypothetical protein